MSILKGKGKNMKLTNTTITWESVELYVQSVIMEEVGIAADVNVVIKNRMVSFFINGAWAIVEPFEKFEDLGDFDMGMLLYELIYELIEDGYFQK